MHLHKISKLDDDKLRTVKQGTQEKIAIIDARQTGSNPDVDAAFARSRSAFVDQIALIDAELARRS